MRAAPPATPWQFIRFVIVGALNTGFSYGVYAVALWMGLHYAPANFVAMCVGTIFSFITQGRLVFGNRDPGRFGRFILSWVVIWGFNVGLIHMFVHWVGLDAYTAGAIALVPVVALSFLMQKYLVFARRGSTD